MAVAREAARYAPPPADTISGSGSSTTVEQALAMLQQALQQQGSGGTVAGGAGGATQQTSLRSVFEHQQQVLRDREEVCLGVCERVVCVVCMYVHVVFLRFFM